MTHTLVAGGTRGIGRAVTRRFAAQGHAVSVLGRRRPDEAQLDNVTLTQIDFVEAAALRTAIADATRTNGALSNVVLMQRYRGEGDAWQGELDVSLTATKHLVEGCAGAMPEGGSIVIVVSNATHLVASEQPVGYHAAKAAMRQMARYYAVTLGPGGIRVNCVTPGSVVKEESADAFAASAWADPLRDATPLRRHGTSEDIASAVALLCGEDAAFVTGHDLVVDGGLSLLWQESLIRSLPGEP